MKTCPQCSATYPDEYVVCPKDGTRLPSKLPWDKDSVIRGKYKILAKLGEGGMASVYKAHHELLDEARALKVIHPELARDAQFVTRFKHEAINTRKLQHPNAVRVDDLDIAEDGRPFIAMEMVEGESLKSLIERTGPMPYARVVDITVQVCAALGAAHALGLTHRDIKPDNIVLVQQNVVKILDFGIARLREGHPGAGARAQTLTGTGVAIGTPEYMSPEQAMGKGGEEIDGRADLYSLGVVMYRMLTGELPFKANTTLEMILHHIQDVPPAPQKLKPQLGIPDSISAVVMKALEKDRDKRFASAAAMAEALEQARKDLTAGAVDRAAPRGTRPAQPAVAAVSPIAPSAAQPAARPVAPVAAGPKPAPGGAGPSAPQSRPLSATRVVPAVKAAALGPAVRPFKKPKTLPLYQGAAGVAVLGIVVLGVMHFMRQPGPATPTVKSPVETAPKPLHAQKSKNLRSAAESKKGASKLKSPSKSGETEELTTVARPNSSNQARASSTAGSDRQNNRSSQPYNAQQPKPPQTEAEKAAAVIRHDMLEDVPSMNDKAAQLFKEGEYAKAAEVFRQVLQIDPFNKRAQKGLDRCVQRLRSPR